MALVDKEARDARLDALATATTQWAEKRRKQLEDEATALEKLLKGRPGGERLATTVVTAATELLVDELDSFLSGQ